VEDSLAARGIDLGTPGAVHDCRVSPPNIAVGQRLASRLTLMPGDTILVASIENMQAGALGMQPAFCQFVVVDIVSTGMYEYDNLILYSRIEAVQSLVEMPSDTVSM